MLEKKVNNYTKIEPVEIIFIILYLQEMIT
jgi:hypothetical protein